MKSKKELQRQALSFAIGLLVFVIFLFPLYWMLVTALKSQVEIFEIPTPLWPRKLFKRSFPLPATRCAVSRTA